MRKRKSPEIMNEWNYRKVILSILCIPLIIVAQTNIAVLNFTARDVSDVEAQVVSDRVRIALKNSGEYTMVERDLMDKLLNEQAFQQSGCVEDACIAQVGEILSVKQIVGGSLSKLGTTYTLEIKMIEVETGKILKNAISDFTGDYQLLLSQAIPVAIKEFLKEEQGKEKEKTNIALMKFESRGLGETEAMIISDRIRLELKNTKLYNVLEREMMSAIINEQTFQQTGCTESECLVEIGQMLAVEKMVSGSISKIGNLYVIEARIIDVESGSIDKNVAEDFAGPIELLLLNTTKNIARNLAGLKVDRKQAAVVFGGSADIYIQSDPRGAVVYFDDSPMKDVTPATFRNMPTGTHTIRLEKGDLVGEQEMEIIEGRLNKVSFKLKEKVYTAILYSNVTGTEIYVGAKKKGTTPFEYVFTRNQIPFKIELRKDGYFPHFIEITGNVEQYSRYDITMEKAGTLSIATNIPANIQFNGKTYPSPLKLDAIRYGSYDVIVSKEYYKKRVMTITINDDNKNINITEKLIRKMGKIAIAGIPQKAQIKIAGKSYKMDINTGFEVPFGEHPIIIKSPGFNTYKSTLAVKSSDLSLIPISMTAKSTGLTVMSSVLLPGLGQMYYGKPEKGLLFSAGTAACIALSLQSYQNYVDDKALYNEAVDAYSLATSSEDISLYKSQMNLHYDTVQNDVKQFLTAAGGAGLIWAVSFIDAIIMTNRTQKIALSYVPHKGATLEIALGGVR